jgi:hypothetical protein
LSANPNYNVPLNDDGNLSKETAKLYKSFMQSYVNRINDSTFRVPIQGIRIGSAKYSRLAQINLKTRIITFSRFAIENVPERGRRYLVLHELAHVLEASHNKYFWQLVQEFEPEYKNIGTDLDRAFKQNVQSHEKALRSLRRREQRGHAFDPALPATGKSAIWTPDHGFVESGSKKHNLHRDPAEGFLLANNYTEETYAAYEEYLDLKEQGIELEVPCIFDQDSEADRAQDMYVYDDEADFDSLYGTISGGDG